MASALSLCALIAAVVMCGWGCAHVAAGPPPPPPGDDISVVVTPATAAVLLGNQQTFMATVHNTTDTAVTWSVNGTVGGAANIGTITGAGVYTAPAALPVPATVHVSATSHANPAKSGSSVVTIQSDIAISLPSGGTGGVTVELGATRAFQANVTSAAHPDPTVLWSVSGASCPLLCGSVDATGNYTAPQILPPAPPTVTLTARGAADPAKQASVVITITSNFALQLVVPASVPASATATFVATLTPVAGSNPSTTLAWSLSGSGCSGATCGTLVVVTTQSAGGNATATSATYTAPAAAPVPDALNVVVTPLADASKAVQRVFTIQGGSTGGGVSITVSPTTATRAINHRLTLTAQVSGTQNT
ncbi:MAG: hypothetical protein ABLT11_10560, partial [Candidatus Acidiferrum sp.]